MKRVSIFLLLLFVASSGIALAMDDDAFSTSPARLSYRERREIEEQRLEKKLRYSAEKATYNVLLERIGNGQYRGIKKEHRRILRKYGWTGGLAKDFLHKLHTAHKSWLRHEDGTSLSEEEWKDIYIYGTLVARREGALAQLKERGIDPDKVIEEDRQFRQRQWRRERGGRDGDDIPDEGDDRSYSRTPRRVEEPESRPEREQRGPDPVRSEEPAPVKEEPTGPELVAAKIWKKVEIDKVYGESLQDKNLDELAAHGPSEARDWVRTERARREEERARRAEEEERRAQQEKEEAERRAQQEEEEAEKKRAMDTLWRKVSSREVKGEKLSEKALENLAEHGPAAARSWVHEEHERRREEVRRAAEKEKAKKEEKRAMTELWHKIERGEVDGKELPDKALRNLAKLGPDESDTWVRAERERREIAELDRLIAQRNTSRPDRGAPDTTSIGGAGSTEGTPPAAALDYDAPSAVVDIEGDMAWSSSYEALEAAIEFPEVVEFFLTCLAKPWQQAVGIQRMTDTESPEPAQKVRGPIYYRPILVNSTALRSDPLLARKTIKAAGRGFIPGRKPWTPIGADITPITTILPPGVVKAQKELQALYEKDPNDWTNVAQEFWKKHNRDERHLPTTLYEEAAHRWFIKSRGPKKKIRIFAPLAWYVALCGGSVANHHDAAAYTKTFTTDAAYQPGGVRSPYGLAVFNNLKRYFFTLTQKLLIDTVGHTEKGTPQEKAFAAAITTLFDKAPDATVSLWQLRNGADKAIERIYKEDARISVEEDHQPGANETAWKKEEVRANEAVTFMPEKPKRSQKRHYPATMHFFTTPPAHKASGWQRALALIRRTKTKFVVLPFNMDAAYDPLLMRKVVKHARTYIEAPEKFTEKNAPEMRSSDVHNAIKSYKAIMKEYARNLRTWTKRVYEIWDAHKADDNRPPQTYLEEAVYRWYFKTRGPGAHRKNVLGQTKKLPEDVFRPLAIYAALNGATVTSQDSVKLYHRPVEDLKTDRYQRPRAPYLRMMEHFIAFLYAGLADAVSDDLENTMSEEQAAFGAGLKEVLDAHYEKMPAMGLLYVRMLVADQVAAHYSQPPKEVGRMRKAAQKALEV